MSFSKKKKKRIAGNNISLFIIGREQRLGRRRAYT